MKCNYTVINLISILRYNLNRIVATFEYTFNTEKIERNSFASPLHRMACILHFCIARTTRRAGFGNRTTYNYPPLTDKNAQALDLSFFRLKCISLSFCEEETLRDIMAWQHTRPHATFFVRIAYIVLIRQRIIVTSLFYVKIIFNWSLLFYFLYNWLILYCESWDNIIFEWNTN